MTTTHNDITGVSKCAAKKHHVIDPRDIVFEVRRAEATAATYDKIEGVCCPMCGTPLPPNNSGVYCTKPWISKTRARHHNCPYCTWGFKSIEAG